MDPDKTSGFSMVELIAVIVILGIVSATGVSTYQNLSETEFVEKNLLTTNLRYARQKAMNSTNSWGIQFAGNSYLLQKNGIAEGQFPATQSGTHNAGTTFTAPGSLSFNDQDGTLDATEVQRITFKSGSTIHIYPSGSIQ